MERPTVFWCIGGPAHGQQIAVPPKLMWYGLRVVERKAFDCSEPLDCSEPSVPYTEYLYLPITRLRLVGWAKVYLATCQRPF